jgi:hypothetical protein
LWFYFGDLNAWSCGSKFSVPHRSVQANTCQTSTDWQRGAAWYNTYNTMHIVFK